MKKMDDDANLCPICIHKQTVATTECGHAYCIECLAKIEKCALCRRDLLKSTLNQEILANARKTSIRINHHQDETYFIQVRRRNNRMRTMREIAFISESRNPLMQHNNVDFGRNATIDYIPVIQAPDASNRFYADWLEVYNELTYQESQIQNESVVISDIESFEDS